MPIRKVEGGYKWGSHGHVYPTRAGAERQAAAAHANGFRGDASVPRGTIDPLSTGSSREVVSGNISELVHSGYPQKQAIAIAMRKAGMAKDAAERCADECHMLDAEALTCKVGELLEQAHNTMHENMDAQPTAAGVILTAPDDQVLFMRRGHGASDHPGEWSFPGGRMEQGETAPVAAARELGEETGYMVDPEMLGNLVSTSSSGFSTYELPVEEKFAPTLNEEHSAFSWAPLSEPPQPLHPGVVEMLFFALPTEVSPEYEPRPGTTDALTSDRGYFAPIEAGQTRRLTPEGFLICEDVGLARVGEQVYSPQDLPHLTPGPDGKIIVYRSPEEVFADETIASFEGKPVTIYHPNEFVNPENHKQLSVGHVQNVRRGEGAESDLLKGDILITDAAAIHYAMQKLPEISCGYDAKYKQQAPGRASQHEIRGNHAALVPNGRAGDRCAIKDHVTPQQEFRSMAKSSVAAVIGAFFKGKGLPDQASAELQGIVDGVPTTDGEGSHSKEALESMIDRKVRDGFKAMRDAERAEEEEKQKARDKAARDAEEEVEKRKKKESEEETGDTIIEAEEVGHVISLGKTYTGDAMTEIRSRAEIMAPGMAVPTADACKGNRGAVLSNFMRTALKTAQTKDAELVTPFLLGHKVEELKGAALLGAFNGVAECARIRNNARTQAVAGGVKTLDGTGSSKARITASQYAENLAAGRKKSAA